MTAILTSQVPIPSLERTATTPKPAARGGTSELDGQREQLQNLINANTSQARLAAERGDVAAAARLILAALDGERRMAATNPQVLQVIRPRA
ncbi:MAG: hypothetical protein VKI39_00275 [Synechococcus sp.]|nr:hypothetical protein [Synechococcus sp.]